MHKFTFDGFDYHYTTGIDGTINVYDEYQMIMFENADGNHEEGPEEAAKARIAKFNQDLEDFDLDPKNDLY